MNTNREHPVDPIRAESALLGAAIGDALGWPYEARARRAGGKQRPESLAFQTWAKRSGGQFRGYEEQIGPGEYSDDTQLILATGRSRLKGQNWHEHWAFVELPLWLSYERGGGGATRRAASALLTGKLPWQVKKQEAVGHFYQAGGNGVAMRVLPLCLLHAGSDDWTKLATEIMANGVCTHGHPNALVGALAYGFTLWNCFRSSGTLAYGQLLRDCRSKEATWSAIPNIESYWPDWVGTTRQFVPDYENQWSDARRNLLDLIAKAEEALGAGALAMDEDAYTSFGCFDPKVNGSGLVAATASLYLASRYASNPISGLRFAVQAVGSDTDTIASMTSAFLGSICGKAWLSDFEGKVQDLECLKNFTRELLVAPPEGQIPIRRVQKNEIESMFSTLDNLPLGSTLELPIGPAVAAPYEGVQSKTKSLEARSWKATLNCGQTLVLKDFKVIRKEPGQSESMPLFEQRFQSSIPPACRVGFSLRSSDLSLAKRFYVAALGLKISKETPRLLNFMGVFTLTLQTDSNAISNGAKLFIEVLDLQRCFEEVRKVPNSNPVFQSAGSGATYFSCTDPDGNQVDVFQGKPGGQYGAYASQSGDSRLGW
jgi:ADP-ribosylglycohydrolase